MLFLDVIMPVVLVAAVGYVFARCIKIRTTTVTKLAFYVFTPSLIFQSFVTHSITVGDFTYTVIFLAIVFTILFVLSLVGLRLLGWDPDTRAASILSLCFNNTGNYGLPILLFGFGEAGFTLGVVYMVTQMAFVVIFGVGVASWQKGISVRKLMLSILKVPWLYAFLLAFVVRAFSISLPLAISRPIELLA